MKTSPEDVRATVSHTKKTTMKLKEINKLVDDFDLKSVGASPSGVMDEADEEIVSVEHFEEEQKIKVSEKFLKVYVVVRPMLQFLSMLFVIPGKWKAILRVFIQALDDLVATP